MKYPGDNAEHETSSDMCDVRSDESIFCQQPRTWKSAGIMENLNITAWDLSFIKNFEAYQPIFHSKKSNKKEK